VRRIKRGASKRLLCGASPTQLGHAATSALCPNCDIGKLSITFIGCCLRGKGHDQAQRLRMITIRRRAWQCYCAQSMRWTPVGESCVECSSRPRSCHRAAVRRNSKDGPHQSPADCPRCGGNGRSHESWHTVGTCPKGSADLALRTPRRAEDSRPCLNDHLHHPQSLLSGVRHLIRH